MTHLFMSVLRLGGGGARVPRTRDPGANQGRGSERQARQIQGVSPLCIGTPTYRIVGKFVRELNFWQFDGRS